MLLAKKKKKKEKATIIIQSLGELLGEGDSQELGEAERCCGEPGSDKS